MYLYKLQFNKEKSAIIIVIYNAISDEGSTNIFVIIINYLNQ